MIPNWNNFNKIMMIIFCLHPTSLLSQKRNSFISFFQDFRQDFQNTSWKIAQLQMAASQFDVESF